jgi:hypothetical protein
MKLLMSMEKHVREILFGLRSKLVSASLALVLVGSAITLNSAPAKALSFGWNLFHVAYCVGLNNTGTPANGFIWLAMINTAGEVIYIQNQEVMTTAAILCANGNAVYVNMVPGAGPGSSLVVQYVELIPGLH